MYRLLVSLAIACVVSLALFLLMYRLVNHESPALAQRPPQLMVDISRVKEPQRVQRQTNEPPPPQETPPVPAMAAATPMPAALTIPDSFSTTDLAISVPQWENSEIDVEQRYWSAPAGAGSGQAGADYIGEINTGQREIVPIATRRPNIPKVAYDNRINGWVLLAFTVANDGKVKDIRIMDAEPRGVFEANAIAAVRGWIYSPFKGAERHIAQRIEFEWNMYSYNMNFE